MKHTTRPATGEVSQTPDNRPVRKYEAHPVRNSRSHSNAPVRATRATVEQAAFVPRGATGRLYGEARFLPRETEVVIVEKKVMDSQLKHVLYIMATLFTIAFIVGLVLWVMS